MLTTNIDKIKTAETALIEVAKDPLLRSFPIITLRLVPAIIDLIHIVREHENILRGEKK